MFAELAGIQPLPADMPREKRIAGAVKVLQSASPVMMGARLTFLHAKGLTDDEITEAMNIASGGALVNAALAGGR